MTVTARSIVLGLVGKNDSLTVLASVDNLPTAIMQSPGSRIPIVYQLSESDLKNVSSPGIKEVSFSTSSQNPSLGLTSSEYSAIACLSILLALIYVSSITLYLHGRKTKRTPESEEMEIGLKSGQDDRTFKKDGSRSITKLVNPMLQASTATTASMASSSLTGSKLHFGLGESLPKIGLEKCENRLLQRESNVENVSNLGFLEK